MCWNQHVSINTFLFGVFVLCLIAFNNSYSKYKINDFKNPFVYFFFMSFISMQFFEFLLWRNLENDSMNYIISIAAAFLLVIQPIASLTMLNNVPLRNKLLVFYSLPALSYFFYRVTTEDFYTTVSKTGHLAWKWGGPTDNVFTHLFYLFFLYYALIVNKHYFSVGFTLLLFAISYYTYYKDGSAGSMWCWLINVVMFYYLFKILIYLPYQEHGLC